MCKARCRETIAIATDRVLYVDCHNLVIIIMIIMIMIMIMMKIMMMLLTSRSCLLSLGSEEMTVSIGLLIMLQGVVRVRDAVLKDK